MVRTYIFLIICMFPGILFAQNADIRLLRAFNSPETLSSDCFFKFVSDSHGYLVIGIPVSIGAAGFIRHDDEMKKKALEMMASAAVNFGITTALKYSINRERPFITYPDIVKKSGALSPSFPSGHTSAAFEAATSLSLSYPKWYIIAPSYVWAGTVGYSRMHLGVHYPSDVLAGAIVGSGSAWLTHVVNRKLSMKSNKKPRVR
jgi:membrane-associated phospholipid phosphatase